MKKCIIASAVEFDGVISSPNSDDLVIAADAGYLNLKKMGITPDVIIGDFDSSEKPVTDIPTETFPVLKDDTDTMLAIKYGMNNGYREFVIYGGLGGKRTDHTVANIQSLAFIAEHGGRGTLVGEDESFTVIRDTKITLNSKPGGTLSIFAYGREAYGIAIHGAVYETENLTLSPFFPLGVSNKFKGDTATVEVKNGYLLIKW